jgi:hypothetical protein
MASLPRFFQADSDSEQGSLAVHLFFMPLFQREIRIVQLFDAVFLHGFLKGFRPRLSKNVREFHGDNKILLHGIRFKIRHALSSSTAAFTRSRNSSGT